MSRLHAQLSALREAGTVHAVRCSPLSRSVLWDHDDGCADFYVVLRYFTLGTFGQHVGLLSLGHGEHGELREYCVPAPTPRCSPHLGVYVFNPAVCREAVNAPLALEVRSAAGCRSGLIQPGTCPLVHTIADLRQTHTDLSLCLLQHRYDVNLRVYAG